MATQKNDSGSTVTAQMIRTRLNDLAAALMAHGLKVRVGKTALVAKNPAASDTDDPRGKILNPGLSQDVALATHDDHTLHWYWCWTGPTRDAPLEMEYMCTAEDIDQAATKISGVLRIHD
jgi:hypothetical protein